MTLLFVAFVKPSIVSCLRALAREEKKSSDDHRRNGCGLLGHPSHQVASRMPFSYRIFII